jgi:hypothetical protein
MMAGLFFPEFPAEGTIDMRRSYYEQTPWIWGIFAGLMAVVLLDASLLGSRPWFGAANLPVWVGVVVGAILAVSRRAWLHAACAVLPLALTVWFVLQYTRRMILNVSVWWFVALAVACANKPMLTL